MVELEFFKTENSTDSKSENFSNPTLKGNNKSGAMTLDFKKRP
jgi:hypothetical protein